MIRRFAEELTEAHATLFTRDPQMKSLVGAMLRRCLPPAPRRSGRPGLASVTSAIRLHDQLKRSRPERPAKEIWSQIYCAVIPGWDVLTVIERKSEADQLRCRVRWRMRARRKRKTAKKAGADIRNPLL